ncbi:MAG TPA: calcium-binding EGF-like domain-containing protein [Myxococcaceae bacterium]|nr:calcium-binding EGF-like domain-containing protein [Myxococcaceae bacterium]
MKRMVCAAALGALALAGCSSGSTRSNLCDPNPCSEENKGQCVEEGGAARCLCDSGYLTRPEGVCEPVSESNCPEHGGDAAEPDECQARARALPVGEEARSQAIEPVGDYDFFRFEGTANAVYAARAVKGEGSLRPRLDLFDQGGVLLAAAEGQPAAQLGFKTVTTAPYFLRVSHSPVDASVGRGGYALTLAGSGTDDHGDGPNAATAISPIAAGQADTLRYGRLDFPGDQDWFRFGANTGQAYRLAFDGAATVPTASLYLASNLNQPLFTAQQTVIDFDVPSNDTAYLAFYGPAEGSYGFQLIASPK